MAWTANGYYYPDAVIKDKAAYLLLHPVFYSTDVIGEKEGHIITGDERILL